MTAVFSPCRRWRYRLERDVATLESTRGAVAFIGLNPSIADETLDDPTIRRCKGFALGWGFRRLIVANAYAWRSTDPRGLWTADDPVGAENDAHIEAIASDVELVVCAWGAHAKPDRVTAVLAAVARGGRDLHALRTNGDGSPAHPLYLPASLMPMPWSPP